MATLILEHSDEARSGRVGATLRDYGHRLDVRRLHAGDRLPPDLDGIDAIVSCGGAPSPFDDEHEWLGAEMDLLRRAHEADLPVVGLCLGCQLLARALGGEVETLSDGIEAGWHEVALTPPGREDPLYAGIAWRSPQVHWHRYHVAKPPAGARVLARSERTAVQAWALGLRTYGIQYHPEVLPETIEEWARREPDALREAGLTADGLRGETAAKYPAFARLAQRLFESMALFVMPLDRRYAGIAIDRH